MITLFAGSQSFGQIQDGSIAPDFTFMDINGNPHNLYSYLDQGKYVAIDISATWCQPCWNYHEEKVMDSLYDLHDAPGDNTWKVIFIEGDGTTNSDDLNGLTTASQGNWIQNSNYTIIDPPTGLPLSDFQNAYQLSFYPTFFLICPDRRVFQTGLNGPRPTVEMWEAVATACLTSGIDEISPALSLSIYPNPAKGEVTISLRLAATSDIALSIKNLLGQSVDRVAYGAVNSGQHELQYDASTLPQGVYLFSLTCDGKTVINRQVAVE
jgi:hypothetical protein